MTDSAGEKAVARAEKNVAWWTAQAASIQRDRARLKWVLLVGGPLAVGFAAWRPWVGLGIAGVAVLTWITGHYLTFVRKGEFEHNIREAKAEVEQLQRSLSKL